MATSVSFRRLLLRTIKWDSEDGGNRLYDSLKAVARARITATSGGKVLISTSVNGKTASYSLPPPGTGFGPGDLAETASALMDLYDEAINNLDADGNTAPTDVQIFNEMLALLVPVRSITNNFRTLRLVP